MPKIHPDGTPKEPEKIGSPQETVKPQAESVAQPETELSITRVVEEENPEASD
ncbi:MAG TPA: hypothetical protein VHC49_11460 [Mycobacteriales bacterium]|nr:hypothetical protein [Mycobacteriales bacterium]